MKYKTLEGQGYHKIGSHSAVKPCKWFKESILGRGQCYKNKFYGIESHRCIQCTPALQFCTNACRFCWRTMEFDADPNEMDRMKGWDEPEFLAEKMIAEQMRFVSGYGGNELSTKKLCEEARQPKQVALSLAGEPMIYPHMSGLIDEFTKRNMTTFLVTNGTLPKRIEELETLPTQLYLSMISPNEKMYTKTARPKSKENWGKYLESLDILSSARKKTRTVLRMTLVRWLNALNAKGYAEQIIRANPDYVEVKSFVYVGGARGDDRGLDLSDMLTLDEVKKFADEIGKECGYRRSEEHAPSRVVLLSRDKKTEGERLLCKK